MANMNDGDASRTARKSNRRGQLAAIAALSKLKVDNTTVFTGRERNNILAGQKALLQSGAVHHRTRAFRAFLRPILTLSPSAALLCLARLGHSAIGRMKDAERTQLQTSILSNISVFETPSLQQDSMDPDTCNMMSGDEASIGSASVTASRTHILFLGIPEVDDIASSDMLGVPLDVEDLGIFEKPIYTLLTPEKIKNLQTHLGPSFISHRGNKLVIHQAVLTILYTCQSPTITADFRLWDELRDINARDQLVESIQAMPQTKMLVFVSCTNSSWPSPGLEEFHSYMNLIESAYGNLAVCPSETEVKWEEVKIGDIRAFNDIAQTSKKFTYRPNTCFGIGECTLQSSSGHHAMKRSYSCGGAHVKVAGAHSRPGLRCRLPTTAATTVPAGSRTTKSVSSKHVWFHQELVKSFSQFGEFRVWLVQGKVFKAAQTRFDSDFSSKSASKPKNLAVIPVDLSSFSWYSNDAAEQQSKWDELYEFAEMINSCLQSRQDADRHYRSLQVGLRLDIGISEVNPNGVFFANEATRFYCADYMSELICQPFTDISSALGEAIAQKCEDGEWWLR